MLTWRAKQLEVGSEETDSLSDDFASIASTIPNYVYENGRRYHSYHSDQYLLPNDEREQERLDFLHHVFRLTLDGDLCYTELDNPQRILDIGTGTVATMFPSTEVIGTDLSPIQSGAAPQNVEFIVDDALEEWSFPEASFDFIHLRALGGSIPDWPSLLKQCFRALKPGGRIEVSEARSRFCCDDDTIPEDSCTKQWMDEFKRNCERFQVDFDVFPNFNGWIREAGFAEVEEIEKVVPIGTWPKDRRLKMRGRFFALQVLDLALDSYSPALFCRGGGWSEEEMRSLLEGMKREIKSNKLHLYTHLFVLPLIYFSRHGYSRWSR
ncbi:hypothetical protein AJ80_03272 [Polytolypa hystricis UAMH7299]|uniref:Methyltransferase domain-containing protein n=1 Tax=Polytolypa hystricis (strain UAMH7299) TaxID=1447883 RepID=A0A2B7YJ90_POLH7|nr:hypothetical protein AJ80_03272 [Polytolypa hystricis UAMH7299]